MGTHVLIWFVWIYRQLSSVRQRVPCFPMLRKYLHLFGGGVGNWRYLACAGIATNPFGSASCPAILAGEGTVPKMRSREEVAVRKRALGKEGALAGRGSRSKPAKPIIYVGLRPVSRLLRANLHGN